MLAQLEEQFQRPLTAKDTGNGRNGIGSVMDMVLTRCEVQKSKLVWGKCLLSKFNARDKIKPKVKFSLPIDKRFVK